MGNGQHNGMLHSPFRWGKARDKSQWNLCSHSVLASFCFTHLSHTVRFLALSVSLSISFSPFLPLIKLFNSEWKIYKPTMKILSSYMHIGAESLYPQCSRFNKFVVTFFCCLSFVWSSAARFVSHLCCCRYLFHAFGRLCWAHDSKEHNKSNHNVIQAYEHDTRTSTNTRISSADHSTDRKMLKMDLNCWLIKLIYLCC